MTESAELWRPLPDIPDLACQVWRLQSDNHLGLAVDGDFFAGNEIRTLRLVFDGVLAFAAHDDMGGKHIFVTKDTPLIQSGSQKGYRWPLAKITNSIWLESLIVIDDKTAHYVLFSLECTVEIAASRFNASWL